MIVSASSGDCDILCLLFVSMHAVHIEDGTENFFEQNDKNDFIKLHVAERILLFFI